MIFFGKETNVLRCVVAITAVAARFPGSIMELETIGAVLAEYWLVIEKAWAA